MTGDDHPSFLEAWHMNVRVANVWDDWSVAKPREKCQPFTYTLHSIEDDPYLARDPYYRDLAVKGQQKFLKALAAKPRKSRIDPFLKIKFAKVYAK